MENTYANRLETGRIVYGKDGEKIGEVAEVTQDYFVIQKGWLFTTDLYVPMSAVGGIDDEGVRLSMTRNEIESSEEWSTQPPPPASDEPKAREAKSGQSTGSDRQTIERSEERLTVDKTTEPVGKVHVGKQITEEKQTVDVPVTREGVYLERTAVDRPASGESFKDESIDVTVYEERVQTGKEAHVVEELEVSKDRHTDTVRVEDTVRREEFDIQDDTQSSQPKDR